MRPMTSINSVYSVNWPPQTTITEADLNNFQHALTSPVSPDILLGHHPDHPNKGIEQTGNIILYGPNTGNMVIE